MRWYAKIVAGVVTLALLLGSAGLFYMFAWAGAQPSSWFSSGDPTLSHVVDFPANQGPPRQNRDCTPMNYTTTEHTSQSGCMVNTALGLMGSDGDALLYKDTSLAIPIVGYNNWDYGLQPVPNQGMVLSTSSAPVIGLYLHFYTNLLGNLTKQTDTHGNFWYTVNKIPNEAFPEINGDPVSANPSTISYSNDGSWMVVEDMQYGMILVNLATFQVVSFAQALNTGPNDYRLHQASTAISDDGRYAIVQSNEFHYFKVFDLSTCEPSTAHTSYQSCQSRDLWQEVVAGVPGFKSIYSVRFTNDDNINFDASYDYVSGSDYKVARYNITAPGEQMHKLDYLAMGDSYISGQGTFVYKSGTDTTNNGCHVSSLAYPFIVGSELPSINSYESVACSGAVTDDIVNTSEAYKGQVNDGIERHNRDVETILSNFSPGYIDQLDFVQKYQPRIITLSVGGDDIHFADLVKNCVTPIHADPGDTCFNSYAERLSLAETIADVYKDLQNTYNAILQADPGVQLYVIGYPQIAVDGICASNVHLNGKEIEFSQQLVAYLDYTIQQAAISEGAYYVNTQSAFAGHRLCETDSPDVALNGFTVGNDNGALGVKFIGNESYHPNQLGYRLLGQEILSQTNNLSAAMPSSGPVAPPSLNDPLAQALLNGYQSDGTSINAAFYDDSFMPSFVHAGEGIVIDLPGLVEGLLPDTKYNVVIHSDPLAAGTIITDDQGNLNGQITIPANTPAGFHTIHMYGPNAAGQLIDIYRVVYIAASDNDYNGDGTPNSADQCLLVPLSGQDTDKDGIDDACDPVIGTPPANTYPATAKLTGNTILIVNTDK